MEELVGAEEADDIFSLASNKEEQVSDC